jgi:hypothetical protein
MLQDRGVPCNGLEQFRQPAPYVILYPPQFKNGDAKTPFGIKSQPERCWCGICSCRKETLAKTAPFLQSAP